MIQPQVDAKATPSLRQPLSAGPHCAVGRAGDAAIRARVRQLLQSLLPVAPTIERRHDRRYPFPRLISLTPVADDGRTPLDKPMVVVGTSLSERGIGFFHTGPLMHRRMIAAFAGTDGGAIELLVVVGWCRFIGQGWYESGGRFVQCVAEIK
ncbi:MAG: hypothetical protein IT427_04085 [Pirellulales bacterium]|nr:hypothetical protein [Pirellulales bacterium]